MRAPLQVTFLCAVLLTGGCTALDLGNRDAGAAVVPERAQRQFDEALASIDAGRASEALVAMESLWVDYPYFSGPALNAALIHQRSAQYDEARTWFERALQANENNLEARNAFAAMLRQQGLFAESQQQYEAALAIAPEHAATHYNIAILYDLYLGKKSAALAHVSRYQELAGDDSRELKGWVADLTRQLNEGTAVRETKP